MVCMLYLQYIDVTYKGMLLPQGDAIIEKQLWDHKIAGLVP